MIDVRSARKAPRVRFPAPYRPAGASRSGTTTRGGSTHTTLPPSQPTRRGPIGPSTGPSSGNGGNRPSSTGGTRGVGTTGIGTQTGGSRGSLGPAAYRRSGGAGGLTPRPTDGRSPLGTGTKTNSPKTIGGLSPRPAGDLAGGLTPRPESNPRTRPGNGPGGSRGGGSPGSGSGPSISNTGLGGGTGLGRPTSYSDGPRGRSLQPRGERPKGPGAVGPRTKGGGRPVGGYGGDPQPRPNVGPRTGDDDHGHGHGGHGHGHDDHGYGHGYYNSYYSPWGFGYSGYHYSSWWWPFYLSCWYPTWYYGYRTHETTIIYEDNDPEVIYVQEPAGEAVVVYEPAVESGRVAEPSIEVPQGEVPESVGVAARRYLDLGDAAFRDSRYSDAVQLYAKAVSFSPEEAALHLVLADALFAAGDDHYAAFSIRTAFELDPTLVKTGVDKHDFYTDPGEFDRHLARLEARLEASAGDADLRLVLATNYLFGRRPAAAVDLLESAGPATTALGPDTAAELVLQTAREVQFGTDKK